MLTNPPISFPLQEATATHKLVFFDAGFSHSKAGFAVSRFPHLEASLTRENLPAVSRSQMRDDFAYRKSDQPFTACPFGAGLLVLQRHADGSATMFLEYTSGQLHIYPLPLRVIAEAFSPFSRSALWSEMRSIAQLLETTPAAIWTEDNSAIFPWADMHCQDKGDIQHAQSLCDLVQMAGAALYSDWEEEGCHVLLNGSQILKDGTLSPPFFSILSEGGVDDFEEVPRKALTDMANLELLHTAGSLTPRSQICQEWDIMSPADEDLRLKPSAILMSSMENRPAFSSHQKLEALKLLQTSLRQAA